MLDFICFVAVKPEYQNKGVNALLFRFTFALSGLGFIFEKATLNSK